MKPETHGNWTALSPYDRFFDFIAPNADRFSLLSEHIEQLGLNSVVIPIEGNRHFFIFPRGKGIRQSGGRAFPFRGQSPVVLTAHYDRVAGSPGANDNSAAVFHLLKTALRLGVSGADYWIIIFTDKEELQSGEGIESQGSYSLEKKLRGWGLAAARIYNFDACGTGDTFVISSTVDYLFKKEKRPGLRRARQTIAQLRERALAAARNLHFGKVLLTPTPFSDDAGFLRGGIPSQTITMLPSMEVIPFVLTLRAHPELIDLVIAGTIKNTPNSRIVPETWRCINGPTDSHLRLTPEHYEQIVRFAVELCKG
jgi:hypothetical protein